MSAVETKQAKIENLEQVIGGTGIAEELSPLQLRIQAAKQAAEQRRESSGGERIEVIVYEAQMRPFMNRATGELTPRIMKDGTEFAEGIFVVTNYGSAHLLPTYVTNFDPNRFYGINGCLGVATVESADFEDRNGNSVEGINIRRIQLSGEKVHVTKAQ
jgi:hypothetical protein